MGGDATRLIDFDDIEANDWLAVNHLTSTVFFRVEIFSARDCAQSRAYSAA